MDTSSINGKGRNSSSNCCCKGCFGDNGDGVPLWIIHHGVEDDIDNDERSLLCDMLIDEDGVCVVMTGWYPNACKM
jgi:hypothetical protein